MQATRLESRRFPSGPQAYAPSMPEHRDTLVAAQYFAAVAGTAAMRHCLTRPSNVRARLDEVCAVVASLDRFPNDLEIPLVEYGVDEGYEAWAPNYDGPNPAVDVSRAVIAGMLADAPRGTALDAACGTGSQTEQLLSHGYEVIGVDASQAMLDVARTKLPAADFRLGLFDALPLEDESVDVVTSSLALTHVIDLDPAIAEMARVLRPGGHVLLADIHPIAVTFGGAAIFPSDEEGFHFPYVRNLVHHVGEYVIAARRAGLDVAECHEPAMPDTALALNPAYSVLPDAVMQAFEGLPFVLGWRLTKPA